MPIEIERTGNIEHRGHGSGRRVILRSDIKVSSDMGTLDGAFGLVAYTSGDERHWLQFISRSAFVGGVPVDYTIRNRAGMAYDLGEWAVDSSKDTTPYFEEAFGWGSATDSFITMYDNPSPYLSGSMDERARHVGSMLEATIDAAKAAGEQTVTYRADFYTYLVELTGQLMRPRYAVRFAVVWTDIDITYLDRIAMNARLERVSKFALKSAKKKVDAAKSFEFIAAREVRGFADIAGDTDFGAVFKASYPDIADEHYCL